MALGVWTEELPQPPPSPPEEHLRDLFESGVWVQHLQDQKNFTAPVQGVRFFFCPQDPARDADGLVRGGGGYICVTPKTAQMNGDGAIKMSLEAVKDAVQRGKAWEANRKAAEPPQPPSTRSSWCRSSSSFGTAKAPEISGLPLNIQTFEIPTKRCSPHLTARRTKLA